MSNLIPNRSKFLPTYVRIITELGRDNQIGFLDGGALVPSKSYWYLLDFKWERGVWRYRSKEALPGEITIRGVDGTQVILERLELSEARETLGVYIMMDGNWREEKKHSSKKQFSLQNSFGWEWLNQMRPGTLLL
jgi:hypothetical protein